MATSSLMDTDLLSNIHEEPSRNEEVTVAGSPCKRRGVGQEDGVSLSLLREILADQTKTLLQHQTKSQGELEKRITSTLREDLREDIRREMATTHAAFKRDIQDDLNKEIQALGRGCTEQFQNLQQGLQAAERGIQDVRTSQSTVEARLQALESRGSDAGTMVSSAPPGKKPALVLGGWDPDTGADDMLRMARELATRLQLDVDLEEMFVPGVRRGFAILPYGPREGEGTAPMRQRVQAAIAKVKAANYTVLGRARPVWLVYSRSPAERRRSALAGKVKRLVLQLQGDGSARGPSLEVEWGSGTVWLGGLRVASAASTAPPQADAIATGGWIDLAGIAQKLRMTKDRVGGEWAPLAAQLR